MVNIGYGVVRRLSGDASISKASEGDIAYGYGVIYLASDDVTPETADAFTLDALAESSRLYSNGIQGRHRHYR